MAKSISFYNKCGSPGESVAKSNYLGVQTMKLSREEVQDVAMLARIALTGKEVDEFSAQLSAILDYVGKIDGLDTEGVEPTFYIHPIQNVWRPDEQHRPLAAEETFANTVECDGNYFRVPRIL